MASHDDDVPVGRLLGRREAVRLLGTGGVAMLAPLPLGLRGWSDGEQAAPGCVVRPEQTEGPYFVDQQLDRSDIRVEPSTGETKAGELLTLALTVVNATGGQCRPLPGATVDIWQCDATGVYSGVSDTMVGFQTTGQKFLRGVQRTDAAGLARFTTIYPGWYPGRTVHIHFKIRTQAQAGAYEFTSQWYFDEALNDTVLAGPDYQRPGTRGTRNANDGIYRQGGDQLTLKPARAGNGLAATYAIGLDLADAAVGRPDGGGGRGRGRGRGGR